MILEFKKLNNFELPCIMDKFKSQEKVKEIQESVQRNIYNLTLPKQSEIITERQNLKILVKYPNDLANERSSVFSYQRSSKI